MSKEHFPSTPATRFLKEKGIPFELHSYKYEEHGGTERASNQLLVDETMIIKTIVMEDENRRAFIILMHGNKEISTKEMARLLAVKSVSACDPQRAQRLTGYLVGGTSPFGTKQKLPIYIESSILDLAKILINAGSRGLLAVISPRDLEKVLNPIKVNVAR